jgi:hypothetical protein
MATAFGLSVVFKTSQEIIEMGSGKIVTANMFVREYDD